MRQTSLSLLHKPQDVEVGRLVCWGGSASDALGGCSAKEKRIASQYKALIKKSFGIPEYPHIAYTQPPLLPLLLLLLPFTLLPLYHF